MRTAFYPCCNTDFEYPSHLLSGSVDRIIFCDIRKEYADCFAKYNGHIDEMAVEFIAGDVREVIDRIGDITIFFYRKDSSGEGGSGVYILGKQFFDNLSEHLIDGALIITDGSNSGDKLFKRMIRPEGYTRFDRHYFPKSGVPQPNKEGLYTIQVKDLVSKNPSRYSISV